MPDAAIFVVGSFVFLLLAGGLLFTVLEVLRLDERATKRESQERIATRLAG